MPDAAAACRHRHRYHAVPVPFDFKGSQYIMTHSNNHYGCPLPVCEKRFRRCDGIECHVFVDHGVGNDTKLFIAALTSEHDRMPSGRL
jgi:hypothetical protein